METHRPDDTNFPRSSLGIGPSTRGTRGGWGATPSPFSHYHPQDSLLFSGEPVKSSFRASTYTQERRKREGGGAILWSRGYVKLIVDNKGSLVQARPSAVVCIYIPGWIPEKGRRDGVKGLPFARRSPAATASTGTLIFDLGRSPFSVHVYSIPTECFFLPWTSLVAARIASDRTDIMDSSPSTPYFSLPPPPSHDFASRRRKDGDWSDFKYKSLHSKKERGRKRYNFGGNCWEIRSSSTWMYN